MQNWKIRILRFNPEEDRDPHFVSYHVPENTRATVLDALIGIYSQIDPTLAFRFPNHDDKEVEKLFVKKYGIDLRYIFDSWNMAHNFWNIPTMARASMVHYNTVEEVHAFLKAAKDIGGK